MFFFKAFIASGDIDERENIDIVLDENIDTPKSSRKGTQVLTKKSGFEKEVGNRAHITYVNGRALWFGRQKIKDFLEILMSDGNNSEVIRNLCNLLKSKVPLAAARTLGIVHACVIGPFQAAFDQVCENIFDIIPYCIQMQAALQEFSENT